MVIEGFRGNGDEEDEPQHRHGFWLLVTTAIATSLDAMAVGVGWHSCRSILLRPRWPLVVPL